MQITLSAIKADIGGIGGHTRPSDELFESVKNYIGGKAKDLLIDYYVGYTGDDIHIIMTHKLGIENDRIHQLAWDAFTEGTKLAKEQGLYGAGQDLLKDAFSGNIKGLGPGVAEMHIEERPSEVFCVFAADKTEPGAFNLPFWRIFVDSRSNTGLLINEKLASGVTFRILDVMSGKIADLKLWSEKAELEAALMYPGRYVVHSVLSSEGEQIVSSSTDRLHNIAGTYVGKDDSIPIVSCLVFSMHEGMLTGPHDGFGTADWDLQRIWAAERAMIMRNQGFIHPATLVPEELEYNKGYQARIEKLNEKFRDLKEINAREADKRLS